MLTTVDAASPWKAIAVGAAATVVGSTPVFLTAAMAVQVTVELEFGAVGLGAAVGTFFGTMALASPPLGRMADRLGARASLRIATVVTAAGAFIIASVATDWLTLVIGLAAAGVAAGLAQPAANRLLVDRVPAGHLGLAFGLKQSAPPLASMLAGLAVSTIAIPLGWRWAYVIAGVGALLVAMMVGSRPVAPPEQRRPTERVRPLPLENRTMLAVLAAGFGLAFAASSVVLAFYVESAVQSGSSHHLAGLVFASASLTAILVRLIAGLACDRRAVAPFRICAALLGSGALGTGLLASGQTTTMAVGVVIALAGTWGFPGVFWYALVRAYPESPGRISGVMAPAGLGGVVGPIGFGALATSVSYQVAWILTSVLAVFAAAAMLLGARKPVPGHRSRRVPLDHRPPLS